MINKTILQGRLTEDPELKKIGENHIICNINIACNKKYKEKETTLFLRCNFWNAKATFLNNYFKKGSQIIVVGELQTESWLTEDGQNRSITTLTVDECHFCGDKKDNPTKVSEPTQTNPNQTPNSQGFSVGEFFEADTEEDDEFPY